MNRFTSTRAGRVFLCVASALVGAAVARAAGPDAGRILKDTGVKGGLVVHLGCGDARLTTALRANDSFLVHGLDADAGNVARAREHIRKLGLYGKVSVEHWIGSRMPYADNIVRLLVANDLGKITMPEVMRVLCPGGVAYVKRSQPGAAVPQWSKTVKPRPKEIDEWTHSLHDPSNNAVGDDLVVGPPRHIQWVGPPRRARQHERLASISAVVSAGGRVFSIQDEGPISSAVLPPKWRLVARDAFSGVILWRRPVGPWEPHLRAFRSGPPEISRRLVAAPSTSSGQGNRVYVTLGYGRPVVALDAATGNTVRTYEQTAGATEILHRDGVLLVVAGDLTVQAAAEAAKRRGGSPAPRKRRIIALRADTGQLLWKTGTDATGRIMPATLAAAAGRAFFQNATHVVCLDAGTGKEIWRSERRVATRRPTWSAPTLVVHGGVVLSADRAAPRAPAKTPGRKHKAGWINAPRGKLIAMSAETGRRLWEAPCREGFHAPVDVLVAGGLVWTGEVAHANDPGITVGRDPETGEIERRRPKDQAFFKVGMPHHRCNRNRATERYLVLARAGVEFIDVASGQAIPHHWTRGTCQFGTLPCNGLLYVPPHSCACYTTAKLNGFYAFAPASAKADKARETASGARLQKGPAYETIVNRQSASAKASADRSSIDNRDDWPTYRRDAQRSGCTSTPVPAKLKVSWRAELGGPSTGLRATRLSSVVVAGGKLLVASIDEHVVHALDARNGKPAWSYTAGGRVDSPPTVAGERAVFGCRDGWVYCLRASDGRLCWRFRAAPEDRRIVAYGQLESVWPVHGSVLVRDGVVYFAAGRSSYIDGGIFLYRLELATGKMLSATTLDSRDPNTTHQRKGVVRGFDLPGALPGVLSGRGDSVFMRHLRFDEKGARQKDSHPHLFCPTGLLDDTWWHRSYWIYGARFYTGYRDWFRAGREVPGGRLLVFDEENVYGFGRPPRYYNWLTPQEYHLFATSKTPKVVASGQKSRRLPAWGQRQIEYGWSKTVPLLARAMAKAGGTLFVAGPPDLLDENNGWNKPAEPAVRTRLADQAAALEGGRGAVLWAVAADSGKKLSEYKLQAPPVWDGLAAARGRLYVATTDGKVLCLGE